MAEFNIKLTVDDTQSKIAQENTIALFRIAEQQAKKLAFEQEQTAKRAADAQVRETTRAEVAATKAKLKAEAEAKALADTKDKEAKRATDAQEREIAKAAAAAAKLAKTQEAEAKRATDALVKEAMRAADAQDREAKRAADSLDREMKRSAVNSAKLTEKQEAEYKRAANIQEREAKRAGAILAKEQAKQAGTVQDSHNQMAMSAMNMSKSVVTSFAGQMIGVYGVQSAITAIITGMERVADNTRGAATELSAYRDLMREFISMQGGLEAPNQMDVAQLFGVASQTLQSPAEVLAMQKAAMNRMGMKMQDTVGQPGSATISPETFKTSMVGIGQLSTAKGIASQDAGELAGVLALSLHKEGEQLDPKKLITKFAQIQKIGDLGAMDAAEFTRTMTALAPSVEAGQYETLEELASVVSTMSGGVPQDRVRRSVDTFTRAIRQGPFDEQKIKGSETSTAGFWKGAGFQKGMGTEDRLKLLRGAMDRDRAAVEAKGEVWDPDQFMRSTSLSSSSEESTALLHMTTPQALEAMKQLQKTPEPSAEAVKGTFDAYAVTEPGQRRRANVGTEVARLGDVTPGVSVLENITKAGFVSGPSWLRAYEGKFEGMDYVGRLASEQMGGELLKKEARRVGVSDKDIDAVDEQIGDWGAFFPGQPQTTSAYETLAKKVAEHGGDPSLKAVFDKYLENAQESLAVQKRIEESLRPKPVPLPAAPQNAGRQPAG